MKYGTGNPQALWPFDILSWNTPSWSISAEFLAYALFGLAVLFGRKRLALGLALAAIAAPLTIAFVFHHGMVDAAGTGGLRAIYGFSIGALVYLIFAERIFRARAAAPAGNGPSGALSTIAEAAAAIAVVFLAWATHETASASACLSSMQWWSASSRSSVALSAVC